jgi:hypothetical protein
MGLSSKKSSTTSQATGTSATTATPNVPDWLANPYKTSATQVGQLQQMDPTQFAPQTSQLEQQAFSGGQNLTTSPNYDTATSQINGINYAPQQVQGQSLLTGLDQYYNPYKDQVLNPVLNDMDVQAGQTRAAQSAKEAATGSFRGSRAGIAEGETEGNLARARATTEGGLLNQMYDTATSLSSQDAARRQEAQTTNAANGLAANSQRLQGAGLLSTIGAQQGSDARANIGVQDALGTQQQQIADAQRQEPLTYQQQLQGLLAGLNPDLFTGKTVNGTDTSNSSSTTKSTPSLMDSIGKVAQMAAMFI